MVWIVGFGVALLVLFYRWLRGGRLAAVFMFPVVWYLIWLAFLPMDPSQFEWIFSGLCAVIVACLPAGIRDLRPTPRVQIFPPGHY